MLLLVSVVLLNGVAWLRARAMTHYAPAGQPVTPLADMAPPARLAALLTGVTVPRPENRHTPRDLGLAYSVHRVALPSGEALEGWFVPQSRPRGIVAMFHGYAASKESLLPAAAALHRLGFALFLVDLRGAGGSSGDTTTLGLREAADVAAAVDYVNTSWPDQPVVLYGVSMGSAAVLRAVAVHGLQPAALILESPFDRLLTTVRHRFEAVPAPAFPAAELLVFWGGVQQGFDGFAHNPADYAPVVVCPTLLMRGAGDAWVTAAELDGIADRLGGPRQVVEIAGASHHDTLVLAAPAQWRAATGAFLDRSVP